MTSTAANGSHCVTQPSSHASRCIIEASGGDTGQQRVVKICTKAIVQVGICMYRSEGSKEGRLIPSEYAHRMRRAGALRAQWQQC